MKKREASRGQASGVAVGTAITFGLVVVLCLICAILMGNGVLPETGIQIAKMVVLGVAVFTGALVAAKQTKHGKLLAAAIPAGACLLTLFLASFFLTGERTWLQTMLPVVAAFCAASLLAARKKKRKVRMNKL